MGCVCLKSDEKKVGWIPLSKMSKVEEMLKHSKFEKKLESTLQSFWEHSLLVRLPFLLSVEHTIVKYGATSHRSYWPVR